MNRVEDNQFHLLDVWISVFSQILFIYKNIDDFGNEIIAGFAFVVFLLDSALQGHWEIGEHRSVNHSRLFDVPSRLLHLLRVVLGRNNAHEIRGHHGFLGSEGNGKLAAKLQVLNAEWREMLGDNFEKIQERYLHTFANLTLTGINSELSNKAFEIKRDGRTVDNIVYPGYKDSKYRLTRSVTDCQKWTEEELQKRSKEICEAFLRLYPLPKTDFKPLPKPVEEVSLDEESFSPTNRILRGFRVFGHEYNETIWKDMLIKIVLLLSERYPDIIDSLYDGGAYLWTAKQADLNYCTQIGTDKYLWTSMGNKGKIACLRYLFDKCDVAESELIFILEPSNE